MTSSETKARKLISLAKQIMLANWRGKFTVPNKKLYPFQWNWDSGFSAMGFGSFKPEFAFLELRSLFSGQWKNGMLPHIIFHEKNETGYFPNPSFWGTASLADAPENTLTSGITQPPVHGFVLERLYRKNLGNPAVKKLIEELYGAVLKSHRFLHQYRDPHDEGLVYIYHPWESGRDNSPLWDAVLKNMDFDKNDLPSYKRVDNTIGEPSERPTERDYDAYVFLLMLGQKNNYAGEGISEESPFLVQDTLFNSILLASNQSLIRLGKEFGFQTIELEEWNEKGVSSFNAKLWNEDLSMFCPFDLVSGQQISLREVGGLIPWFANIPDLAKARKMLRFFRELSSENVKYRLCPSFDPFSPNFNSKRYWRGPIWPQINWLLYRGLENYAFSDWAEKVKSDIIELVDHLGFHEYFEPETVEASKLTRGYGASDFTWTAAVILDLLSTP